jgi:hypothetical protein
MVPLRNPYLPDGAVFTFFGLKTVATDDLSQSVLQHKPYLMGNSSARCACENRADTAAIGRAFGASEFETAGEAHSWDYENCRTSPRAWAQKSFCFLF